MHGTCGWFAPISRRAAAARQDGCGPIPEFAARLFRGAAAGEGSAATEPRTAPHGEGPWRRERGAGAAPPPRVQHDLQSADSILIMGVHMADLHVPLRGGDIAFLGAW